MKNLSINEINEVSGGGFFGHGGGFSGGNYGGHGGHLTIGYDPNYTAPSVGDQPYPHGAHSGPSFSVGKGYGSADSDPHFSAGYTWAW